MTHLTNKQRTELLIQLAQEATGLTVEAKGNPPEADIDTWDMLRKKTKRGKHYDSTELQMEHSKHLEMTQDILVFATMNIQTKSC